MPEIVLQGNKCWSPVYSWVFMVLVPSCSFVQYSSLSYVTLPLWTIWGPLGGFTAKDDTLRLPRLSASRSLKKKTFSQTCNCDEDFHCKLCCNKVTFRLTTSNAVLLVSVEARQCSEKHSTRARISVEAALLRKQVQH